MIFFSSRANPRPTYTATVKQTFEQTLMDGNTIRWTVEAVQARDETGRTMRATRRRLRSRQRRPAATPHPDERLRPCRKDLHQLDHRTWNDRLSPSIYRQPDPMVPPDWKDIPRTPSAPYRPRDNPRRSRHPHHRRNGSHGHCESRETFPAGAEGNDMPLKVVHETWTNRQNHTTLSDRSTTIRAPAATPGRLKA